MNIFLPGNILLPRDAELQKWAVIACDQFTSDPDYWEAVEGYVADQPSALRLILPESFLSREDVPRTGAVCDSMCRYLDAGIFREYPDSYIYVERTLENGSIRKGIVGVVDLEEYDYRAGSQSPVRATEMTVLERLPTRKLIRKSAAIDLSHVLMLCDDDTMDLMGTVTSIRDALPVVYDFDLMQGGGHITGRLVQADAAKAFDRAFSRYQERCREKYRDLPGGTVILAAGDGNHSLAAAKSCYEDLSAADPHGDYSRHPARYALVELVNLHDPALVFEPIHRVVFDTDATKLLADIQDLCAPEGTAVKYVCGGKEGQIRLDCSEGHLPVAVLQDFLDGWLCRNPGRTDYIHGREEVLRLTQRDDCVGFLLPAMEKGQLFRSVITRGILPRKTFSMGHAREKRYYLEGRKLT